MGELVAGQDRTDHFAHADHVAFHVACVACRVGDGHSQCEARLRSTRHGVELF